MAAAADAASKLFLKALGAMSIFMLTVAIKIECRPSTALSIPSTMLRMNKLSALFAYPGPKILISPRNMRRWNGRSSLSRRPLIAHKLIFHARSPIPTGVITAE